MFARWRPALRKFYLRTHPDLLQNQSAAIREKNEVSMKVLSDALTSRPTKHAALVFYVLSPCKERIEVVKKGVIRPVESDTQWQKLIDGILGKMMLGIVPDTEIPVKVKRRTKQKTEEEIKSEKKFMEEMPMVTFIENADFWMESPTKRMSLRNAIRYLFERQRITCTSDVDEGDAFALMLQVLSMIDRDELDALSSPLLSDIRIVVTSKEKVTEGVLNRRFTVSVDASPDDVVFQITKLVDEFQTRLEVHS